MASGLLSSSWQSENFYETTLSADCTDVDTDIFLTGVPTNTEGTLVIDPDSATNREIIYYSSKTGTKVVCPVNGRGYDTSTAVSHTSGTKVIMAPIADWFNSLKTLFTTSPQGWTSEPELPDTITNNGNRSYDLVFNSTDLTDTLSTGMRLRLTRTVSAPTQCADLEASSSQYFSSASAGLAGMTFTDDFVVSAWIKLESYVAGTIASRYNGTSGWGLELNASGQILMTGRNGGAGNVSYFTSYQSIPLGKWVHVAGQLDMSAFTATTTTSYLMIDGVDVPVAVARAGTNPTALIQAGDLQIGAFNAGQFFDGKIAQVAIFSAKVTQATMRTYISQGLAGTETSLVSAFSCSNSLLDLNTTNNNDLTASGGALATDVDSPFGNYLGGTLDYAIITKTAFSTNTTLTVQVPEGCTIPTSGGVSAVAYSTQDVPYGFPREEGRWAIEHFNTTNATTASLTGGTWSPIIGANFTVPTGRFKYGYSAFGQESAGGAAGSAFALCLASALPTAGAYNDPTIAGQYDATAQFTGGHVAGENSALNTTATTYTLYGVYTQGTATVTVQARGDITRTKLYAIPDYF